ncbi:MAG: hypothetical protein QOH68_1526, partial [Nocardioidaceae bacterium]|nr:hypothetical protein [Nocardioidaceae bacterium]
DGLKPFGSDVFNASTSGGSSPTASADEGVASGGSGIPATGTTAPLAIAGVLLLAGLGVLAGRRRAR